MYVTGERSVQHCLVFSWSQHVQFLPPPSAAWRTLETPAPAWTG